MCRDLHMSRWAYCRTARGLLPVSYLAAHQRRAGFSTVELDVPETAIVVVELWERFRRS